MGTFGRLILATAVLLVQTSLGRVLCACPPESPAPPPANVAPCPMSLQPGCTCCGGESSEQVKPEKQTQNRKDGACQTKAEKKQDAKQVANAQELPADAPLLAQPLSVKPLALIDTAVQTHLVVPRIRPPDPGLHGLRAPPAR